MVIVILPSRITCAYKNIESPVNSTRESREAYAELIKQLLATASARIPPNANNLSEPARVNLSMNIDHIENLDTQTQLFTAFVRLNMLWYDRALSWNRDEFPVDAVYLQPDTLWRPEIVAYNALATKDQFMKVGLQVKVRHDGLVFWTVSETLPWSCPVDIRLFPFDQQRCFLAIGSWFQSAQDVDVYAHAHPGMPSFIHPEWDVVEMTQRQVRELNAAWNIVYTVVLKRKWMFYLLNVLLPVLLVTALNSVVLVLPVDCGEKMSVSVTAFLTLAVFTTLIQDNLPNNSDTVCYLAVYLATQMILSVVVVILSAVIVKCHHSNRHASSAVGIAPVSSWAGCDQMKEDKPDDTADDVLSANEYGEC